MRIELTKYHDGSHYYSYDNVLFVRTISVDYYVTEEHVVFLLHVPLLDPITFDLYHLYSVPTTDSTVIIPPTSYVAMTGEHTYYLKDKCLKVQQEYFCKTSQIERNYQQDTCVQNLLRVREDPHCTHVRVEIADTLVETISDQKYIILAPKDTLVHEKCGSEEVHKLKGSYLVSVPFACKFVTKNFEYANLEGTLPEEPVHLPPAIGTISNIRPIQLNLKSFGLDQLSKLTLTREDIEPLSFIAGDTAWTHSNFPILMLILLIIIILLIIYYRLGIKRIFQQIFKSTQLGVNSDAEMSPAFPTPASRSL